jgi:hypothetical protein
MGPLGLGPIMVKSNGAVTALCEPGTTGLLHMARPCNGIRNGAVTALCACMQKTSLMLVQVPGVWFQSGLVSPGVWFQSGLLSRDGALLPE